MKAERIAQRIIEKFEEFLDEKGIEIPCEDPEEQKFRRDGGNNAKIYGDEYCRLEEEILLVLNEETNGGKNDCMGEKILNTLRDMRTKTVVELYNRYCEANSVLNKWIYSMEEFDEVYQDETPYNIAMAINYGNGFDATDLYFYFDDYGHLSSFTCTSDGRNIISLPDIAEYVVKTKNPLGNEEIRRILEKEE